ncbi:bis-aminopropyl spermidine synthase family protein [Patescibacteria group bacterium]|nr:bis-aminopropyl spermidine synthase family protein [Patescibacteria group bacterium]
MKVNKKIYLEFLEVSKQTSVPIKKVLDIFWHLSKNGSIENNELLRKIGVSKNALNQVKKALSLYLMPTTKETKLTTEAIEKMVSFYPTDYMVEENLLAVIDGDIYKEAVELLAGHKDRRCKPRRKYDQFTATIETTARRVSLLNFFGDIREKRILFLGDDDFTSIPTASLKIAQNITVVDIDTRILNEIANISEKHDLDIERLKYDVREPIPNILKNQFDVVFTDPPYTPKGIKLFVSRAIEMLDKKNKTARLYVCYGNSDRAKERFLLIQEILTNSGLVIRWVFDKFNRYYEAESIGSTSSLFVTEITPKTKPLIIQGDYNEPIYTNN